MDDEFNFDLEQLQKAMDAAIHSVPSELTFEQFVEWANRIYHAENDAKESSGERENE